MNTVLKPVCVLLMPWMYLNSRIYITFYGMLLNWLVDNHCNIYNALQQSQNHYSRMSFSEIRCCISAKKQPNWTLLAFCLESGLARIIRVLCWIHEHHKRNHSSLLLSLAVRPYAYLLGSRGVQSPPPSIFWIRSIEPRKKMIFPKNTRYWIWDFLKILRDFWVQ